MLYILFESRIAGWDGNSSAGIMMELFCIVIHLLYSCSCCLACDPCWCHQNVHAGGRPIGPDSIQRCDWLLQENGDREASEFCGGARSYKHTPAMSRYGKIRGFTVVEKAFQDSSNCGLKDVWEIAFGHNPCSLRSSPQSAVTPVTFCTEIVLFVLLRTVSL